MEEVWAKKDPKIIHGYLFGGLIGEGSYAKVKEVVEEHSLTRRAVKIIKVSIIIPPLYGYLLHCILDSYLRLICRTVDCVRFRMEKRMWKEN